MPPLGASVVLLSATEPQGNFSSELVQNTHLFSRRFLRDLILQLKIPDCWLSHGPHSTILVTCFCKSSSSSVSALPFASLAVSCIICLQHIHRVQFLQSVYGGKQRFLLWMHVPQSHLFSVGKAKRSPNVLVDTECYQDIQDHVEGKGREKRAQVA